MRNLSLLFLFTILSCQSSKTSTTSNPSAPTDSKRAIIKNASYKPFSEFNGDTLQYLNYNFVEHKGQYIGKTFSVLYHDLEIPVKSCIPTLDANNAFASSSISLCFYDTDTETYIMHNTGPSVPTSYSVIVRWEKPLPSEPLIKLYKASNGNWTPGFEAFVAGAIIKNVSVLKYVNPQNRE